MLFISVLAVIWTLFVGDFGYGKLVSRRIIVQ